MAPTPSRIPSSALHSEPSTYTYGGIPLKPSDYSAEASVPPSSSSQSFPRISLPVPMLRHEYDVVVVGSGYGGGVAASRMARAGKSVCVLEFGKERWPGEYPVSTVEAVKQLHVSGNAGSTGGAVKNLEMGEPNGMFHLIQGEGQNAFVANGLGGTSLINANIFLETDDRTMTLDKSFPEELRTPGALSEYYDRARSMLQPTPYPEDHPELMKLNLLKKQADLMELEEKFYRPPQTTFFKDGLNSTGVEMKASTLSGQDCTGVNDGSKSSVLMNYLPDAWNWGAEIFCECEVRFIKKDPSGKSYIVFFAWHGNNGNRSEFEDLFHRELMWVRAKELCFLAAGTLGTTEILLRSKSHGMKMSPTVGHNMSGNGDILAFGYNTDETANAIGRQSPPKDDLLRPVGPTITGVIDMRDEEDVLDGFVLEEGAVPQALGGVLQLLMDATPGKEYPVKRTSQQRIRKFLARASNFAFGPWHPGTSLNRTQVYLIMSHDSNSATLTLEKDKTYLRFEGVGRSQHVKQLNNFMAKATHAIGGALVNSPFFTWGQEQITVHPIGGANLSFSGTGEDGVTNHIGEVFTGNGTEVHDGLFCVDGSVVPCALGVNPFATITALAERSLDLLTKQRGLTIDLETKNGKLDLINGKPRVSWPLMEDMQLAHKSIQDAAGKSGVRFAEVMDGHVYLGDDIDSFEIAEGVAQGNDSTARFLLSVDTYSTENLVNRADHASMITGTFTCSSLSKDPFLVLRGGVQFFSPDERDPDTRNLAYKFDLLGTDGQKLHFDGYKVIDSAMAFSVSNTWKATTTLYVTITRPDKSRVARGILHIKGSNFVREMKGFGPSGAPGMLKRLTSMNRFLLNFTLQTSKSFFFSFQSLSNGEVAIKSNSKVQPSKVVTLTAEDGVQTTMHCWSPRLSNSNLPPLLFVPGASVDHQIFALPTVDTNAVEFFLEKGFNVYIVTHRIGRTEIAKKGYTIYDARLDVKAAMKYVRDDSRQPQMYCVAHCAGSVALSMGLLDSTIPANWIKGLTASQVFFNPLFANVNMLKASSPVPLSNVYEKFAGDWFDCVSSPNDGVFQRLTDQLLRLYPVGSREEMCSSRTCHRSELVFGRLWTHKRLNKATHDSLHTLLGGISMNCLEKLMHAGTSGAVFDNEGISLISESNLGRLEGIPILFIHGGKNAVFSPESTTRSFETLQDLFSKRDYERVVFPEYGHLDCWMGEDANEDVYVRVHEHIEDLMEASNARNPLSETAARISGPV